MPVSKILAAIQEQTGNKIIDGRREAGVEDDRQIKVQFSKTPFWKALDRVLDDSGLTLYPYAEQKAVKVMPKTRAVRPRSQRASYSGPLRFEPIALLAQSDLRDPTGDSLRIRVEVSWEPRIAPVNLQLKISDLKVSDGEGKPIKLEEKEANLEIPVEPESNTKELVIPLSLPPRDTQQIGRLTGTLTALVPGKVETFRFDDLEKAKKVEKRVAGVTVTLEEVRKNNKLWEVRTLVRFDDASGAGLAPHVDLQQPVCAGGQGRQAGRLRHGRDLSADAGRDRPGVSLLLGEAAGRVHPGLQDAGNGLRVAFPVRVQGDPSAIITK